MFITMRMTIEKTIEVRDDTEWLDPEMNVEEKEPKEFWKKNFCEDIKVTEDVYIEDIRVIGVRMI